MKEIIATQEIYEIFEEQFNLSEEIVEESFLDSYVLGADEFINYEDEDEVVLFNGVVTEEGLYMTHQLLIDNQDDLYVIIANEENTELLCYFYLNLSTDDYSIKFPK